MSTNKRRKLEQPTGTPSAGSAVSAIAARRRLAAAVESESSSPPPEASSSSSTNAFSALQRLSRSGNSISSPRPDESHSPQAKKKRNARQAPRRVEDTSILSGKDGNAHQEQLHSTIQYSSFLPSKKNYRLRSDGVVELRLQESERFLVIGSFGVKVVEGQVIVAGASLRPSPDIIWIHAPLCYAIPVLRTREHTRLEIHHDNSAIALRQLGHLSPLMSKLWPENETESKPSSPTTFQILYSSEDAPARSMVQDLVSPPAWNKKLSELLRTTTSGKPLTALVCGPKSSGKSTFSRILTNRLLTEKIPQGSNKPRGIVVLDLDPGQPEYVPPGALSLIHITKPNLTPPFAHTQFACPGVEVLRSHALASVSPASDPDLYRKCALDLFDTYKRSFSDMPLIINTAGWIQGTGLELLEDIIMKIVPGEVLYLSEEGPLETVETLRVATSTVFTELPSQTTEFTSRTAAHLRSMQGLAYFHSAPRNSDGRAWWDAKPLSAVTPWRVRYSGPRSGIRGILSYDHQSPPELLADTINGMVLALVEIENEKAFQGLLTTGGSTTPGETRCLIPRTPEGIPFIPNPNDVALDPCYSRNIGLCLIRGIDTKSQALEILTPIPVERIIQNKSPSSQLVLVHGKFDAPSWAYTEDLHLRTSLMSPKTSNEEGLKIEEDDTEDDDSEAEPDSLEGVDINTAAPWIEILRGNQKRPVGSKVWRVRRDLGKNVGEGQ